MYVKMYRAKIVQDIKNFFPKLSLTMHKGQGGKICVLGGSKEYTGAPYYAATAALRAGGDLCKYMQSLTLSLASIFAPTEATIPLKSYSPEFIVHSYEKDKINDSSNKDSAKKEIEKITQWFKGQHALIMGPGYGRDNDPLLLTESISAAMENEMTLVGDADFLWYL